MSLLRPQAVPRAELFDPAHVRRCAAVRAPLTWALVAGTLLSFGLTAPVATRADEPPSADSAPQKQPSDGPSTSPSAPAKKRESASSLSGPRELLALYGLDSSRLESFVDGRPVAGDEVETLMRFLFAVRRFRLAEIDQWKPKDAAWETFALAPAEHRGQIVPLSGRVVGVAVETPLPEIVARFDLPRYYRCDVRLGEDQQPATIYALSIPAAWKIGVPLDERITASAFFVKFAAGGDAAAGGGVLRQPVFIAQRLAWHPRTVLGDLDMDAGLLEGVRDGRRIEPEDREAFYHLLAAVGRAGTRELARHARGSPATFVELLQNPKQHAGELVVIEGVALRALRVRVDDPDIVARFGIDHYYEVEISVDLKQPVKLDGELYGTFPAVVCVRQLPHGMPTGENIHEHVRVPAFFFKIWAYRTESPDAAPAGRRQIAPLLIGREPLWIQDETAAGGSTLGAILIGLFVAGIAGLWLVVWKFNRGDARFKARTMSRRGEPDADVSLDGLPALDRGAADFHPPADT